MKIAMFTDSYRPQVNGVVVAIDAFKEELERRGHEVFIFCPKPAPEADNVFPFPSTTFPQYPEYKIALPVGIERKFAKIKPDIVHIHTPFSLGAAGIILAKLFKKPLIGTYHTPIHEYVGILSKNPYIKQVAEKLGIKYAVDFYKKMDIVTAPSPTTTKFLIQHGLSDVRVLPNGIKLEKFANPNPNFIKENYNIEEDVVLFFGRVCAEKRVDTLLQAYPFDAHVFIIGDGPVRKELEQKYPFATFTGYIPYGQLLHYIASSVFVINPSPVETQGLTTLEAFATRKTVIGANAGAIPDVIEDGYNGFLFETGNAVELKNKIDFLLENSRVRHDLELNAYKTAQKFTVKKMTDELLSIYSEF